MINLTVLKFGSVDYRFGIGDFDCVNKSLYLFGSLCSIIRINTVSLIFGIVRERIGAHNWITIRKNKFVNNLYVIHLRSVSQLAQLLNKVLNKISML